MKDCVGVARDDVLDSLDVGECVKELGDEQWSQVLKALDCLTDKHKDISSSKLTRVCQELHQLQQYTQVGRLHKHLGTGNPAQTGKNTSTYKSKD